MSRATAVYFRYRVRAGRKTVADGERRRVAACRSDMGTPLRYAIGEKTLFRSRNSFRAMKSRPLTYLLLVVALGIWGVVAWKLFFSGPKPAASDPAAVPVARNNPRADIDTLRLDYPDPFLRAVATRPSVPGSVSARAPVRSKAKNERPAAKLACTGRIRKEGTDRYLISINGRNHLLRQGESAGGFRLHAVGADSLWLAADGRKYGLKIP